MEPRSGIEPPFLVYETSVLPLNYPGKFWKPRSDLHRRISVLQTDAFLLGYGAMAEEARLELASPFGRHFSKVVAYQLAVLLRLFSKFDFDEDLPKPVNNCRRYFVIMHGKYSGPGVLS